MDSIIKVTGSLELVLRDKDGIVKQHEKVNNLVVTTGKILIASRLIAGTSASAYPFYMGVGTGTVDPTTGDTALGSQLARVSSTTSIVNNVITFSADFNAGTGTGALTEAGMFDSNTNGIMLCRTKFGVINKASDDTLTIKWNLTIG